MTNKKIYRKIKRSGIIGSLILFLVFCILTAGVLALSIQAFSSYAVDTKTNSAYEAASHIKRLYEAGLQSEINADTLYKLLDAEESDYLITDNSGNIVHAKGNRTDIDTRDQYSPETGIYTDKDNPYLYLDKKGQLSADIKIVKVLWNLIRNKPLNISIDIDSASDDEIDEDDESNDESSSIIFYTTADKNERFAEFPFWISFDLDSGDGKLICKADISVTEHDGLLILEIGAAITLLFLALLIYLLISTIRAFKRQKRIINYFFTDPVTGGRNWMWYQIKGDQMLKRWRNRNKTYAIVSLSLINFRNYCVCHSVEDGDKLLCRIDNVIRRNLGKGEMCAHNSSSTFALILRYENIDELKQRLNMLILNLEIIEPGHKFSYQAGVSLIDRLVDENGNPRKRKSLSLQHEYNNASTAKSTLSESDESGVAFFDEKIVEDQKWLDSVQDKQAKAVANEEFAVYYQPKYDPRTNELRGAEALIRWQSPDFGFVAPYKFIPIFEKNGFITEIDHYMLSHVARDQRGWLDAGFKCVPVSVNVSRAHFIENDLAEQIRDTVDGAGCPHNLIEIELTESAFFDDKKAMIETINKLKSYGFAVSMDDFGAGYSSLNSLKDMPLDVLKLDADFFRGESADGRGEIVVAEAIKLAKSLNMRIVAEGVEIKEQVDFLAGEGCDMIQGYYFAKPMPGNDYEQRMRQMRAEQSEADNNIDSASVTVQNIDTVEDTFEVQNIEQVQEVVDVQPAELSQDAVEIQTVDDPQKTVEAQDPEPAPETVEVQSSESAQETAEAQDPEPAQEADETPAPESIQEPVDNPDTDPAENDRNEQLNPQDTTEDTI
ncbi:MAG: EAL domain-containing protein [Lachnospiraceae bacterium]|nr:EAL domain-containing protein [Lachnospiraceae bacterium]